MSEIRDLLDENTPHAIGDQLRLLQPRLTIQKVGDELSPPLGTPDPELLLWLEREGYCLITRNRRSMPEHLSQHLADGRHVPGIFLLRPGARLGSSIDDLLLIHSAAQAEDYRDMITHVPL